MSEYSDRLAGFLDWLREVEDLHRMARDDEEYWDKASQDIYHALEFGKYNYHGGAKMAIKLGEVRRQRRQAKDTLLQTQPIVDWISGNQPTVKKLEQLLGEVRKAENYCENRTYFPRTDILEG